MKWYQILLLVTVLVSVAEGHKLVTGSAKQRYSPHLSDGSDRRRKRGNSTSSNSTSSNSKPATPSNSKPATPSNSKPATGNGGCTSPYRNRQIGKCLITPCATDATGNRIPRRLQYVKNCMNTVNKKSVVCPTTRTSSLEIQSRNNQKSVWDDIVRQGLTVERKLTPEWLTLKVDNFALCKTEMFKTVYARKIGSEYDDAEFDCCATRKNGECIALTDFCRCLQEFESYGREEKLGKKGKDIALTFETFKTVVTKKFEYVVKREKRLESRLMLKYENHRVKFEVTPNFKDKTKRRTLLGESRPPDVNNGEPCDSSGGRRRRLLQGRHATC